MKKEISNERVSEYMTLSVPVITLKTSVGAALRLAQDHDLTALPVCEGGRFLGLVSEKELLDLTPSKATTLSRYEMNELLDRVTVGAVTKRTLATVEPDAPLSEAASAMLRNSAEVLAVVDHDRFAGLITWKEILAAAMEAGPGLDCGCGAPP